MAAGSKSGNLQERRTGRVQIAESCFARYFKCSKSFFTFCSGCSPKVKLRKKHDTQAVVKDLQPASRLPGPFEEFLEKGQLFTGLVLATCYSEKYKGRDMTKGDDASVKLPFDLGTKSYALLGRYGKHEATPFIWLEETAEAADDVAPSFSLRQVFSVRQSFPLRQSLSARKSKKIERKGPIIYVAFGPMRSKRQYVKIVGTQGARLVDTHLPDDDNQLLKMSSYIKEKLDHLWSDKYGFGNDLERIVEKYSNSPVIFCGISHGGAMAQAAALRYVLEKPANAARIHVASWNAYKWTDEHGRNLAGSKFEDRLLPLVMSSSSNKIRTWDAVPSFPPGDFSSVPGSMLLDVHTGMFFSDFEPEEDTHLSLNWVKRMVELHFAKGAIHGLKLNMERVLSGKAAKTRRNWKKAIILGKTAPAMISVLNLVQEHEKQALECDHFQQVNTEAFCESIGHEVPGDEHLLDLPADDALDADHDVDSD